MRPDSSISESFHLNPQLKSEFIDSTAVPVNNVIHNTLDLLCSDFKMPRRVGLRAMFGIMTAAATGLGINEYRKMLPLLSLNSAYKDLLIACAFIHNSEFQSVKISGNLPSLENNALFSNLKNLDNTISLYIKSCEAFIDFHHRPSAVKMLFGSTTMGITDVSVQKDISYTDRKAIKNELAEIQKEMERISTEFSRDNAMIAMQACQNVSRAVKFILTIDPANISC